MSDASLIFNILGRDGVSSVFDKIQRKALETAVTFVGADAVSKRSGSDTSRIIRTAFSEMGAGISSVAKAAGQALVGNFSQAAETIGSTLSKSGPAAIGALVLVGGAAAAAAGPIGVAIGGALISGMGAGIALVPILFAAKNDQVKKSWLDTINHMKTVTSQLSQPFVPVLQHISGSVRSAFDRLSPIFGQAFAQMAPHVQGFADNLISAFTRLGPSIGPITKSFSDILDRLGPMLPGIFQSLADAIGHLAEVIGQHSGEFAKIVKFILDIVPAAIELIAWMVRVGDVVGQVVSAVSSWFFHLGENIGFAVGGIRGFVVQAWAEITAWVTSKAGEIVNTVTGAWGAVVAWTFTTWNTVVSAVVGAASRLWGAVTLTLNSVVGFVASIPGRILGALGNLGGLLYGAGRDVIQGLINGFNAKVGELLGRAASIVNSIKNTIAGALHIGSPSKITTQYGVWIGEGLALGMAKSAGMVSSAAGALSDSVTAGLAVPATQVGTARPAQANSTLMLPLPAARSPLKSIPVGQSWTTSWWSYCAKPSAFAAVTCRSCWAVLDDGATRHRHGTVCWWRLDERHQ